MKRYWGITILLLICILVAPATAETYSFFHTADTQMDPYINTPRLNATFSYLESLKEVYTIRAIIISGDLIQHCNQINEWENYTAAKTHTTIPIYEIAGNHDTDEYAPFTWDYYDTYIGSDRRFYSTIIEDFIFVGLGWTYTTPDITPFITTLKENPTKIPLISSHQYMDASGTTYYALSGLPQKIRENLILRYSILLCGHYDGFLTQSKTYGDITVTESMTSYHPNHIGDLFTVTKEGDAVTSITVRAISLYPQAVGSETFIYPPAADPVPDPTPVPIPTDGVDLIVSSVRTEPQTPSVGDTVHIYATITNIGDTAVPKDKFHQAVLRINGNAYTFGVSFTPLAPGQSLEMELDRHVRTGAILYWIATAGTHPFTIKTNDYLVPKIIETTYENNRATLSLQVNAAMPDPTPVPTPIPTPIPTPEYDGMDLVINGLRFSPATPLTGEPVRIYATVRNAGSVPLPFSYLPVTLYVDGAPFNYGDTKTTLNPGETVEITIKRNIYTGVVRPWIATPGTHAFEATVNRNHKIKEIVYSNNIFQQTLFIS